MAKEMWRRRGLWRYAIMAQLGFGGENEIQWRENEERL